MSAEARPSRRVLKREGHRPVIVLGADSNNGKQVTSPNHEGLTDRYAGPVSGAVQRALASSGISPMRT